MRIRQFAEAVLAPRKRNNPILLNHRKNALSRRTSLHSIYLRVA